MKNKQFLINLLVVLALLGFLASSIFIFQKAFVLLDSQGHLPEDRSMGLNPALVHIANGLTGLVGGIVAAAFGTQASNTRTPGPDSAQYPKLRSLGNLVYSGTEKVHTPKLGMTKARYGFLYALAYILVGLAALVIWVVLGENTIPVVSNTAATFLGMMIPIVATYFKE